MTWTAAVSSPAHCPCASEQHTRGTYRSASFEVIAVAQIRVTFCDMIL